MNVLNKKQWYQLKDALLCAKYSIDNPAKEFDTLPLELKNHKIGLLINDYLVYGKSESLINAAKLLAPDTKNFWVALERA